MDVLLEHCTVGWRLFLRKGLCLTRAAGTEGIQRFLALKDPGTTASADQITAFVANTLQQSLAGLCIAGQGNSLSEFYRRPPVDKASGL
jgi:hypothetical protein